MLVLLSIGGWHLWYSVGASSLSTAFEGVREVAEPLL